MNYKDYYQILGLTKAATQDEIKRAYRKLARKYHPDVSKEAHAEERFKELGEAYERHYRFNPYTFIACDLHFPAIAWLPRLRFRGLHLACLHERGHADNSI